MRPPRCSAILALAPLILACTIASPAFAASSLSPQPGTVSFIDQDVYAGSHQSTAVTLTNGGAVDTTVSSVDIVGVDASQFKITSDGCKGQTVAVGKSCEVDVEFAPTTRGAKGATLEVVDDSGTLDVPLAGTGITGTLTASPNPLPFKTQPWFYGGQQQSLNLDASNDAGVQVSAASIVGPDASAFYIAWGQNCTNQIFNAGTGCGMGIGFNATGPGTFIAQLQITSDGASSPLAVPLAATALSGPHTVVTPEQLAFGDVAIGQERAKTAFVTNDGDAPMQVQQLLFITGRPDVFFVTSDTCTGKLVDPGKSCEVVVHFKPSSAGDKEASLFLITGNQTQPVTPVGANGTGVPSPDGAAVVNGRPVAGGRLSCAPAGFPPSTSFDYRWLRDGRETSRTGNSVELSDDDIGAGFACRIHASNSVGARTVTSAPSAPVTARELGSQPGAFIDRWACRTIDASRVLSVGGRRVSVDYGHPVTPGAPLALRSSRGLTVSIDGRRMGQGRRVKVRPAALSSMADGAHALTINSGGATAATRLVLAPCRLALRIRGGHGHQASIGISARTGIRSLRISLPRGLHLARTHKRRLGSLRLQRAGLPGVSFDLVGKRTRFNDITALLTRHGLRVTGLPDNVGVLRFRLRRGVLVGRGGQVGVRSVLMGDRGLARASASTR